MSDTLYRKDENGVMVPATPEGRGKAEAARAFLAQGGGKTGDVGTRTKGRSAGLPLGYKRTRGGQVTYKGRVVKGDIAAPGQRFLTGPMRGMTQNEAESAFEKKWAGASDAVKNKYAAKAGMDGVLAPSEKAQYEKAQYQPKIAGTTPTPAPAQATPAAKAPAPVAGQAPAPSSPIASKVVAPPAPAAAAGTASAAPPAMPYTLPDARRDDEARIKSMTSGTEVAATPATAAMPEKPVTPGLSPLAQREIAKRQAAVDATPTGRIINPAPPAGINRLTGLPMGYQPGDKQEVGGPVIDQKLAAESVKRQEIASSKATYSGPLPPKAIIAPAPVRYADARAQYQAEQDPAKASAKAKEMDAIAAGASSQDQATITADSLKRSARISGLGKPQILARR